LSTPLMSQLAKVYNLPSLLIMLMRAKFLEHHTAMRYAFAWEQSSRALTTV
jgi:hypothetical protein